MRVPPSPPSPAEHFAFGRPSLTLFEHVPFGAQLVDLIEHSF
jgi:hypothetical protein